MDILFKNKKLRKCAEDKKTAIRELGSNFSPSYVPPAGYTLAEKLDEMEMSSIEFAVRTGLSEKTVSQILGGKSAITPASAVLCERVTHIPARFWLNRQALYDEYRAKEEQKQVLQMSYDWARKFNYNIMAKYGWVPKCNKIEDKAMNLLSFFGVASHQAWEDYYLNKKLNVAFRISLHGTKDAYALSAWLRQGELQSKEIKDLPTFSVDVLKAKLPEFKTLMTKGADDYPKKLQRMCQDIGIALVYTRCIPKTPLSGCARWVGDTPIIQISGRGKKFDKFWFSFFHEVGHIILHGKKDIFLEDIDYSGKQEDKEKAADNFASDIILSKEQEDTIINGNDFSIPTLTSYAQMYETNVAMIIGRLHKLSVLKYCQYDDFIPTLDLFS